MGIKMKWDIQIPPVPAPAWEGMPPWGFYSRNVFHCVPANGPTQKEEWWDSCDTDGNLSGLVWRRTYTMSGSKIISYKNETFFKDGTVAFSEIFNCYTSGNNYIEKKVM